MRMLDISLLVPEGVLLQYQGLVGVDIHILPLHLPVGIYPAFSLVESFRVMKYFQSVLHHQSYAIKNQLKATKAQSISCLTLVLYGIRIGGFHARKESIRSGYNRFFPCMEMEGGRHLKIFQHWDSLDQ